MIAILQEDTLPEQYTWGTYNQINALEQGMKYLSKIGIKKVAFLLTDHYTQFFDVLRERYHQIAKEYDMVPFPVYEITPLSDATVIATVEKYIKALLILSICFCLIISLFQLFRVF